ncbi:carbohydrate ABC transporter permease [Humibacter ginsenosidimutans]|uniref:Carbohydrate ABC transporter permease n=1 Tax=Humibacter ginsenosidimutans TaxID=2599293 RepID=A0A5B8M4G2_9MICO|nr:carbohydrate ABC transporter permease [Humibacter ginsenosidimutans]QDZ14834.1 carbohydrate ABC transporter permease [Humibacter ginsenosidimutans]
MTAETMTTTLPADRRARDRGRRPKAMLLWIAEHTVLCVLAVLFLFPVVFVLLTSLMSSSQTLTPSLWPNPFDWGNYVRAFTQAPLALWFGNSLLYAVLATVFMLVSSVPAAYALAKLRFRGSNVLFVAIIVAMLLPPQVTAVPIYVMWSQLGLTGTLWPLILPNLLGDAFSIFLMRQFFLTIPTEYADAARIDGNGEFGVLTRVIVPMAKPGIAAAAIFMFFNSWNDYFGPLLYTSENSAAWPVAYGLASFRSVHGTDWGITMAMTLIVTIPVVVVFFFAQRVFVEGITLTGVKG